MSLAHFLSSTSVLDLLSHFCFAFRVALVSFFLSLSRSILSFSPSRSSSVFLPVLRLCLSPRALIWPPGVQLLASFSLQFFRHRIFADGCDEERVLINLRGNTPFYFSAFFFRDAIHSFLFIDQYRASPYDSAFVSLVALQTAI